MNKKFKALIVDFDGTLVDENFSLSAALTEAVTNLIRKGIIFSIATGRPYQGIVKEICERLNLTSPQIVSGGSRIINPKTNQTIWSEYFPKDSAIKLIKYFLDHNYDFSVEGEDFIFAIKDILKTAYGPDIVFSDIKQINYEKISKIVLFNVASIDDPQKIEEKLNNLYPDLHFVRAGKRGYLLVLDITSEKATKHLAVLELAKILDIDPKEIVGVGDGYNDYPLLSVCGYKVAMENAPAELKEIADLIIPDVSKDGLVTLIKSLYN